MKNDLNRPQVSRETPITYHVHLDEHFGDWAGDCGMEPIRLREASEMAIRERHNTEGAVDELDRAREHQPDIFNLDLGNRVQVFYTIEESSVVIRGYAWELQREPHNELDGGSYYCEPEWYPKRLARLLVSQLMPNESVKVSWFKRALKKVIDFRAHLIHRSGLRSMSAFKLNLSVSPFHKAGSSVDNSIFDGGRTQTKYLRVLPHRSQQILPNILGSPSVVDADATRVIRSAASIQPGRRRDGKSVWPKAFQCLPVCRPFIAATCRRPELEV